jgi:imidazolonepropionase-like amidohydrolase
VIEMDRPLAVPRNTFRVRLRRNILIGVGLLALVIAIGSLPVAFVYFMSEPVEPSLLAVSEDRFSESPPQAIKPIQTNQSRVIAFVNVNVIPMDKERVLADQTVIVKDGVIAEMGPGAKIKAPASALRVDGRGKYLMPGLVDCHVHLTAEREAVLALLQLFIANGVTTVLNLRGTPEHLELRASVEKREIFGPTIYTAGSYVNQPFVNTPDEVERAVVEQKRAGYDFVKMHGDLSREAYARLFAVARREGIRVIGHAPRNLGLEAMFEERQYAVVHAEEYIYDRNHSSSNAAAIEPRIPELAQSTAKAGIWVMPNLTAFKNIGMQVSNLQAILDRPEMRFMPPRIREGWGPTTNPYTRRLGKEKYPEIMALYELLEKLVRGFRVAGVRMLIGTDALNTAVVPGFSMHDELNDLVAAGLTPYEALRAATANAAEFLGAADRFGTIAAGKHADLILVEGDPLKDVANAKRRAGVMMRGQWMTEAELRKMLDDLVASYSR